MIWYLVFSALFLIYQLDVIIYSVIALVAFAYERLRPVPGHPAFDRKHPTPLVFPPRTALRISDDDDADDDAAISCVGPYVISGAKSGGGEAAAAEAGEAVRRQVRSLLRASAWTTATQALALDEAEADGAGDWPAPGAAEEASLGFGRRGDGSSGGDCSSGGGSSGDGSSGSKGRLGSLGAALSGKTLRLRPRHSRSSAGGSPHAVITSPGSKQSAAASATTTALGPIGHVSSPAARIIQRAGGDVATLLPQSLVERYDGGHPLVLIQLPMYNEEAHCEMVIERACRMEWPRDKLLIQVRLVLGPDHLVAARGWLQLESVN
jgi:hypothetical protein